MSHHEWSEAVIAQHDIDKPFAPENGQELKFTIGESVVYTNDYGVSFNQKITGFYKPEQTTSLYAVGYRYFLDKDSHWMPVKESNLTQA